MSRILCDVDGVVADLMGRDGGGYSRWCREQGIDFDPEAPANLRTSGQNRENLLRFLREPNAYMRYVNPIEGARESLARLQRAGHEVRFVTSVTEEPGQYVSKDAWLRHYFGHMDFETLTIPSREKHYHIGDYMIDDRADTIARFLTVGERRGLFLFKQPWNFAYGDEGYWRDASRFADAIRFIEQPFVAHTHNWSVIEDLIMGDVDV